MVSDFSTHCSIQFCVAFSKVDVLVCFSECAEYSRILHGDAVFKSFICSWVNHYSTFHMACHWTVVAPSKKEGNFISNQVGVVGLGVRSVWNFNVVVSLPTYFGFIALNQLERSNCKLAVCTFRYFAHQPGE